MPPEFPARIRCARAGLPRKLHNYLVMQFKDMKDSDAGCELDWSDTTDRTHGWSDDQLLSDLCSLAFTIPAQDYSPLDPFVHIKMKDKIFATLPHQYRLPLLFIAKYQWEMIIRTLSLQDRRHWVAVRDEIFHLSRLCHFLFWKARKKDDRGGMEKGWRCGIFDRALTRFYIGWPDSSPDKLEAFISRFGSKVYERDVFRYDWKRWAIQGCLTVRLTKEDVDDGITADDFKMRLSKIDDVWTLRNTNNSKLRPINFMPPTNDSPSELTDLELSTGEDEDTDITAKTMPEKRSREPVEDDGKTRLAKRTKLEDISARRRQRGEQGGAVGQADSEAGMNAPPICGFSTSTDSTDSSDLFAFDPSLCKRRSVTTGRTIPSRQIPWNPVYVSLPSPSMNTKKILRRTASATTTTTATPPSPGAPLPRRVPRGAGGGRLPPRKTVLRGKVVKAKETVGTQDPSLLALTNMQDGNDDEEVGEQGKTGSSSDWVSRLWRRCSRLYAETLQFEVSPPTNFNDIPSRAYSPPASDSSSLLSSCNASSVPNVLVSDSGDFGDPAVEYENGQSKERIRELKNGLERVVGRVENFEGGVGGNRGQGVADGGGSSDHPTVVSQACQTEDELKSKGKERDVEMMDVFESGAVSGYVDAGVGVAANTSVVSREVSVQTNELDSDSSIVTSTTVAVQTVDSVGGSATSASHATEDLTKKNLNPTLSLESKSDDTLPLPTQCLNNTSSLSTMVEHLVSAKMLSIMQTLVKSSTGGSGNGKAKIAGPSTNATTPAPTTTDSGFGIVRQISSSSSTSLSTSVVNHSMDTCDNENNNLMSNLLDELKTIEEARERSEKEHLLAMRQLHGAEVVALRRRLSYLEPISNLLDELKTIKEARERSEEEHLLAMRQLHGAEVVALRRRLSYLESKNLSSAGGWEMNMNNGGNGRRKGSGSASACVDDDTSLELLVRHHHRHPRFFEKSGGTNHFFRQQSGDRSLHQWLPSTSTVSVDKPEGQRSNNDVATTLSEKTNTLLLPPSLSVSTSTGTDSFRTNTTKSLLSLPIPATSERHGYSFGVSSKNDNNHDMHMGVGVMDLDDGSVGIVNRNNTHLSPLPMPAKSRRKHHVMALARAHFS